MVFEFLDLDLKAYLDSLGPNFIQPDLGKVGGQSFVLQSVITDTFFFQRYMLQLLRGLAYCHSHRILHRSVQFIVKSITMVVHMYV